jgi:ankyrin repeat protein
MFAQLENELEIFRYLTGKGADMHILHTNNTALHVASASVSVDIMKLLLDK